MKAILLAVLVCDVGGAGSPQQAQPVVYAFLRHLEKTGGWAENSLEGAYRSKAKSCEQYMQTERPALLVADLATYLARQRSWRLHPVAQLGQADEGRYHLLVREGSYQNLRALRGKTLVTARGHQDAKFIARIVFGGKIKPGHWRIAPTKRPLRGLRKVARGQADATLVDDAAYRYLDQLKLPVRLHAIYHSASLPGLTLAITEHGAGSKQLIARVRAALPELCRDRGKELCRTFGVSAFAKAHVRVYRKLQKQYGVR